METNGSAKLIRTINHEMIFTGFSGFHTKMHKSHF